MEQPCGLFHPENPRRGIVAEAPPVAEKARRGWRSGQNLPALQAWQILGTARGLLRCDAQRRMYPHSSVQYADCGFAF